MLNLNFSALINLFQAIRNPALLYPSIVIQSFDQLNVPLNGNIKAVILDKDNCFAKDSELNVFPAYKNTLDRLKKHYPGDRLLIVSNSAGTNDDVNHRQASILEKNTGITVFRHSTKKPGCHPEIYDYLRRHAGVNQPAEIAVVGDRMFTDVLMAGLMGAYSVWIIDGVDPPTDRWYGHVESAVFAALKKRGFQSTLTCKSK